VQISSQIISPLFG